MLFAWVGIGITIAEVAYNNYSPAHLLIMIVFVLPATVEEILHEKNN